MRQGVLGGNAYHRRGGCGVAVLAPRVFVQATLVPGAGQGVRTVTSLRTLSWCLRTI